MNVKFGRHAPKPGLRKLKLANYLKHAELPAPQPFINWTKKGRPGLHDVLANDQLGDCTAAGMMHIEDIFRAESFSGLPATTRDETIWFYSATTGYIPGDPSTDQGGDERTVLNYARDKGLFADGSGKIAGFVAVDGSNPNEWKTALWLFGNLYFGVALPDEWVNPFPHGDNFTWDAAGPANPNQGHCLTGDTLIPLLNGREATIAGLANGEEGDQFWVYSCDDRGRIVPGLAHSARLTNRDAQLIKVTLDSGETIRCTPDHPFLTRDGSYVLAGELAEGASLMPLYRRSKRNYEEVLVPASEEWGLTHRLVASYGGKELDGMHVHHIDCNPRNNTPSNLQLLSPSDHTATHACTDERREISRILMGRLWADDDWAAEQRSKLAARASEGGKSLIANGGGFAALDPDVLKEIQRANGRRSIDRITSPEIQARARASRIEHMASDPSFRSRMADVARCNLEKAVSVPLTEKQREARRRNAVVARAARAAINHKVAGIRSCGNADVYDLSVEKHHNFALSAGVFVHNCFVAGGYNRANAAIIDTWGMMGAITEDAIAKYTNPAVSGELWTILSPDWINRASSRAPNGIDFASLQDDLASIGAP